METDHFKYEYQLDKEDLAEIDKLDEHFRYVTGEFFVTDGNSYSNIYDE